MYTPTYKGPIEGYAVKSTLPNLWKLQPYIEDMDEAMQEAWLTFDKCAKRYPDLDTPQHFMAIYKRAWANRMNDMADKATLLRDRFVTPNTWKQDSEFNTVTLTYERMREQIVGEESNDGILAVLLEQAPREVRTVLNLMLNAPQEILDVLLADWRGDGKRAKAKGGQRINAALGFPADFDAMGAVEDYFTR